ncbi:MAG TPA: UrcA family protein [Rhizomicrobium sp.]|nr:UrcA family protein [Rhizomicrobium sp.]
MQTHAKAMLIGGSLALMAQAAGAQNYGTNPTPYPADAAPPENVIVSAPPVGRSYIGAAIRNVSVSRTVRTDDLDLRTEEGAQQLRNRVFFTADSLCHWLNAMNPIDAEGWSSGMWPRDSRCYRDAVQGGMKQAVNAVSAARGGTYAGYGAYGGYGGP